MGNDAACRVVGIENIRVKNMRKNLISLGTLDGNEFNYKSANGVMKVNKGVMTLMKGQKLVVNIYKLMVPQL